MLAKLNKQRERDIILNISNRYKGVVSYIYTINHPHLVKYLFFNNQKPNKNSTLH